MSKDRIFVYNSDIERFKGSVAVFHLPYLILMHQNTCRLDTATWYHDTLEDSEDSEALAYVAEDMEVPMAPVAEIGEHTLETRKRTSLFLEEAAARPTKVLHITSSAQIRQLKGLSSEDVARLLEPSMRSKPRKPVHPRISVVF